MSSTLITTHQLQVLYPLCVDRKKRIVVTGKIRDSSGNELSSKCLGAMVKKSFVQLVNEGKGSSYKATRTGISAVLSCLNTQEFRALEQEHGMIPYGE